MTAPAWPELEALFPDALARGPAERAPFLAERWPVAPIFRCRSRRCCAPMRRPHAHRAAHRSRRIQQSCAAAGATGSHPTVARPKLRLTAI